MKLVGEERCLNLIGHQVMLVDGLSNNLKKDFKNWSPIINCSTVV